MIFYNYLCKFWKLFFFLVGNSRSQSSQCEFVIHTVLSTQSCIWIKYTHMLILS